MLRVKRGVDLAGIRTELLLALLISDSVYTSLLQKDCTVTAIRDGKHKPGSKHYVGLAADLRTSAAGITPEQAKSLADAIQQACGEQFDVLVEPDHIHLEFDPEEAIL